MVSSRDTEREIKRKKHQMKSRIERRKTKKNDRKMEAMMKRLQGLSLIIDKDTDSDEDEGVHTINIEDLKEELKKSETILKIRKKCLRKNCETILHKKKNEKCDDEDIHVLLENNELISPFVIGDTVIKHRRFKKRKKIGEILNVSIDGNKCEIFYHVRWVDGKMEKIKHSDYKLEHLKSESGFSLLVEKMKGRRKTRKRKRKRKSRKRKARKRKKKSSRRNSRRNRKGKLKKKTQT